MASERELKPTHRGGIVGLRSVPQALTARIAQGELGALPIIAGLSAIWIFFAVQEPVFLTARNLSNLVLQIAITGTIAIGVVLVLLLGEIDLSVGSVMGLTAAVLGVTVQREGWPWWAGLSLMLVIGLAIGAFQGAWCVLTGVPSFVVTLAGLLAWLGVQLHVLGMLGTVNVFDPTIGKIATTYLPTEVGWALATLLAGLYATIQAYRESYRRRAGLPHTAFIEVVLRTVVIAAGALGAVAILNHYRGVPTAFVILLGLLLVVSAVTTGTRFGRHIYAVGGNAEAARRAGINVVATRISVFALCGFFAAVAGMMSVSRAQAASTQTGTGTLLLEAIAAAVIGGTSLFGGRGTVWAALLGALVIGSVSNGLDLLGQSADIKYIVQGAVLLIAITIDALARRSRVAAGR